VRSSFCLQRKLSRALGALLPLWTLGPVCAVLLLAGASWTTSAADAGPGVEQKHVTAMLLVAQGDLSDSDFADSVVLVMNNLGPPAPVGVIVNRPTPITVAQLAAQLFPHLKRLAAVRDKVYFGGPVELDSVWFLFRAARAPERAVQAFDGVCLSADRDLLLQLLARDKPMDGLKIFVGHSGWAPGQLQAEIARGDWSLKRAESEAVFNSQNEHPWPAPQNSNHAA
jgi:putative transcriptional regulator